MDVIFDLTPIFLTFLLGFFLKGLKAFDNKDGNRLLHLVFYLTGPLLTFRSLVDFKIDSSQLVFLLSPFIFITISFLIANSVKHTLGLNRKQKGVFVTSSMIFNTGFVLPFIISSFGDAGVARFSIFNATNSILTFSWIYAVAVQHGRTNTNNNKGVLIKVLKAPSIWAVLLGLVFSYLGLSIPRIIMPLVQNIGDMTGPLIMIALGLIFNLKVFKLVPSIASLLIRIGLGIIIGFIIVNFFNLHGIDRSTLLLLAAAPIGFNTVTFASLENLDEEYAASIVSIGLFVGLILMPLLIFLI